MARCLIRKVKRRFCVRGNANERRKETMSRRFITTALSIMSLTMISLFAQAQQRIYQGPSQSTQQAILRLQNTSKYLPQNSQPFVQQNPTHTQYIKTRIKHHSAR